MTPWHVGSTVLAAVALFAAAAACAGSDADKAGGEPKAKPIVLTLESEDDLILSGAPEFADALERLSSGSMRIEFVAAGRGAQVNYDRGVVQDVRDGKAQLGIVGVRVWDTLGVTSFQALLAPFLVDSQALQRRVLESPLAVRMLDGIETARVVGVAVLPGPLRRPFGISRILAGPEDYQGAKIGDPARRRCAGGVRCAWSGLQGLRAGLAGRLRRSDPRPDRDRVQRLRRDGPHGERRALAEAALDRDESRGVRRPHARAARA